MKAQYEIQFQSEAQREAFEELLLSMQVPFRKVEANAAEEPESEYRTAPEDTPAFRAYAMQEIRLGMEDIKAGQTVAWEEVEQWINKKLEAYELEGQYD